MAKTSLRVQKIHAYENATRLANLSSFIKGGVNWRGVSDVPHRRVHQVPSGAGELMTVSRW